MATVLVVGAGIAGLVAARVLEEHGHEATVLDKGRLVECGSHADLLANEDGLYARLYRMQFEAGLKEMLEAGLD